MTLQELLKPEYALYLVAFLWLFYGEYIRVMGIYRAHLQKLLKPYHYILLFPYLLLGITMDILANFTIATVVFEEMPTQLLVTTRLKQIIHNPNITDYRKELANDICHNLLDPFDPSGKHCE